MSELTPHHRGIIRSHFEQVTPRYLQVSHQIHARPELGNQEYFAAETLTDLLRDAGFTVTRDIAGHETGFVAHKGQANSGPRIGYLAEYDALPGLGHACGHNLIGTSSVAAAIALSHVVDQTGGEVWVFGTPAEEGGANGSAKGSFADAGVFDGIDAALMIHGSGKTQLTSASLAVDPLDFHFTGRAAHASASPEEGINALDAVIQLFTGINALRQQLPGDTRIHGIITHGGEAPNIIPEYAAARFYIRASTWQRAQAVSERVRAVAEGAALATGSTLKVERFQNPVKDLVINRPLDTIVGEELVALGEGLSDQPRRGLGSTDAGNASHVIPVSHCYIKIGPDDLVGHTPEFREAAASPQGDRALLVAAQALAFSGYRLLTEPSLLESVKADFLRTHSPA
ncbi:amidohydrolase [Pectobacterium araliae]|uniref:Peptidase M20 domain-containing protein 2 n=1 Tax=Pectobacterium araliae TaxID=3073862 RepID=A0AAN0KBB2_9GAMM|nr:M20 family metallopeptidase [Pectobacterium sp. MAFF 302110]GKW19758.1 amidohydrolase [Pectobacterium carotovorum subsp. carotovorum]